MPKGHDGRAQPAGSVLVYASPAPPGGEPYLEVWKDASNEEAFLTVRHAFGSGRALFVMNREGSRIQAHLSEGLPFQDAITYFLGPVLGCLLRLRQVTCLHAGVAVIGGRALALIGPKGSGKSTTVAALAYLGCEVLSDDIAVLAEAADGFLVQPGYPQLRLRQEILPVLPDPQGTELPRILSFADKRFQRLSTAPAAPRWKFQPVPVPLGAVFLLSERGPLESPVVVRLTAPEGLLALSGNVYPDYQREPDEHHRDFRFLGRLSRAVPVCRLSLPDDLGRILSTGEAIRQEFLGIRT